MDRRQRINELAGISASLSRRERYAVDAYFENREEKGAKRQAFEMTLEDTPVWTAATWAQKTRLFWQRKDVESYLEKKRIEMELRSQGEGDGVDLPDEVKNYTMLRKELERKQKQAEAAGDDEMWLKYTQALLSSMKQDNANTTPESNVHMYVPLVCVDDCPLYKARLSEIQKEKMNMDSNDTGDE